MQNLTKALIGMCLLGILASCGPSGEAEQTEEPAMSDSVSVVGTEVSYSIDTLTMEGYLAYDENIEGARPGVLVVHEWWGHNEYVRKRADMLAGLGYTAFALDMYGGGRTADHPSDAGRFAGMVMQNMESATARFVKAMEILQNDPHTNPDQIAAIGYCFGGGVVLNMALRGVELDAVASFHGSLPTPDSIPGEVHARILVCHGKEDPMVSDRTVEEFKNLMQENNVDMTFKSYDGAMHAFTNPRATELGKEFDIGIAYNAEADTASWSVLKDFLTETFSE